jgi:DNA-binding response OmpR family regulator
MQTLHLSVPSCQLTGLHMTPQPRILVADDDLVLCMLLRETLRDAGYDVLVAHDGDELVRMAQEQSPDLLLVDLMMPLMDGFEAIRQLRNDTRTAHLPMIILTARGDSSEVVTGFDSGADDYIIKPYDIDVLLARIRGHLRRAAQLPVRNPLTGLPGNVLLQAELEHHLIQNQGFDLLYIDLDNFKAFNDAYGFARGDRAIHLLAHVLSEVAPKEDFLGHIGGDDFAIIHFGPDVEALCCNLIEAFDQKVGSLYDTPDLQRGYLQGVDRQGVLRRFGLLSLSIAVVSSHVRRFYSVDEMSKIAAELKAKAKLTPGSSYEIDRRHERKRPPVRERRGQRRPTVLLVCANEPLRNALTLALRNRGYRPIPATDLIAAHTILARTPNPTLVVADATLGEQLWDLWKHVEPQPDIIALVADDVSASTARSVGAQQIIVSTEDTDQIVAQILAELPQRQDSSS